ncbi:hypothetical protein F7725_025539 [Dissostichus mawsoni]|uniref:Uncharacterized protein n=1 Tax=Dissostichus mawsoni TaxID=36200 RepID=A0A7J5XBH4_DISMA|nr:hypothetical protein F7725_025539 [Dissostichus mawsoni]
MWYLPSQGSVASGSNKFERNSNVIPVPAQVAAATGASAEQTSLTFLTISVSVIHQESSDLSVTLPRPSPPAQHQRHRPGQVQESSDGSLRHQRRRKDPEERAGSLPRPQTQLTDPHNVHTFSFFPYPSFHLPSLYSSCDLTLHFWAASKGTQLQKWRLQGITPHFDFSRSLKPASTSSDDGTAQPERVLGSYSPFHADGLYQRLLKPAAAPSAGGYSGSHGRQVDGYSPEGSVSSLRAKPTDNS